MVSRTVGGLVVTMGGSVGAVLENMVWRSPSYRLTKGQHLGLGKVLLDTAAAWAQQHGPRCLTMITYANRLKCFLSITHELRRIPLRTR